jgi:hypothetical protein
LAKVGDYFPEYKDKIYAMALGDETMALINFDQVSAG